MPATIPPINFLTTVDSTNNYAMAQVHAGLAKNGMAWFAHEQYAGKGQRNKQWDSAPGENITMSIALQPTFIQPSQAFSLSATIALAVYDLFSSYAGDETKIKWPNDIYWRDRKAGGILIENVIGASRDDRWPMTDDCAEEDERANGNKQLANENWQTEIPNQTPDIRNQTSANVFYKWSIAGIGININQTNFSELLINPVSLKQITGKSFDAFNLAGELHKQVIKRFEQLQLKGFEEIYREYISSLYKINQTHKFKTDNRVFEALVKNITPLGKLVLQHSMEEEFDFGEIEWQL